MYNIAMTQAIPAIFPLGVDDAPALAAEIVELWDEHLSVEAKATLAQAIVQAQHDLADEGAFGLIGDPLGKPIALTVYVTDTDAPQDIEAVLREGEDERNPLLSFDTEVVTIDGNQGIKLAGSYRLSGLQFSDALLEQLAHQPADAPTYELVRSDGSILSVPGSQRDSILAHDGLPPVLVYIVRLMITKACANTGELAQLVIEGRSGVFEDYVVLDEAIANLAAVIAITK